MVQPDGDNGKGGQDNQADILRIKYGFWVVMGGFVLVGIISLVATWRWSAAGDVTAVIGSVTGIIGTIVGAFFGVHVGSAGKEKAEAARDQASQQAQAYAGFLSPKQFENARRILEESQEEP